MARRSGRYERLTIPGWHAVRSSGQLVALIPANCHYRLFYPHFCYHWALGRGC